MFSSLTTRGPVVHMIANLVQSLQDRIVSKRARGSRHPLVLPGMIIGPKLSMQAEKTAEAVTNSMAQNKTKFHILLPSLSSLLDGRLLTNNNPRQLLEHDLAALMNKDNDDKAPLIAFHSRKPC